MTTRTPEEHVRKALGVWCSFSSNDRAGLRFGLFPSGPMDAATKEGFDVHALSVALMKIDRTCRMPAPIGGLFRLGRVVITPGGLELLERRCKLAETFLARHVRGDWGDLCEDDVNANAAAVCSFTRILSAYKIEDEKLWVITEADRSATTLLLPSEY